MSDITRDDLRKIVAYADPPYLGQSQLYPEHPEAAVWDDIATWADLIADLSTQYDGWALSLSAPSLREILPLTPSDTRVLVWVKPFAAFKKHVNPSYAWEPIIIRPARPRSDAMTYMRDWAAQPITLKKGLTGAKPPSILMWLFDAMNMQPGDRLDDLFPGTGIVGKTWEKYSTNWESEASKINRITSSWEMGKGAYRDEQ